MFEDAQMIQSSSEPYRVEYHSDNGKYGASGDYQKSGDYNNHNNNGYSGPVYGGGPPIPYGPPVPYGEYEPWTYPFAPNNWWYRPGPYGPPIKINGYKGFLAPNPFYTFDPEDVDWNWKRSVHPYHNYGYGNDDISGYGSNFNGKYIGGFTI